jgi:hypothetical protein
MNGSPQDPAPNVVHISTITCPECRHAQAEPMPEFSCAIAYQCTACGTLLRPLPDDCCVYCSYGSAPCPAVQITRRSGTDHRA